VFLNDNSFLDFHDSRLFKTFSPVVDSSLCFDSCHASYSCSGHVLDSHDLDTMPDSPCLLSESRLSVLDSRPHATSSPVAFGLLTDYFLFVYRCHRHFVCLFGEHIYTSTSIMKFVTLWSSAGQLGSTIPVLSRYKPTFIIIRAPRNSQTTLMLISEITSHAVIGPFLIIRFRVLWRCLL